MVTLGRYLCAVPRIVCMCNRVMKTQVGLGKKIRRLIWPCSADDDAAARRLGWCCCWGAALRLAGRAAVLPEGRVTRDA